MSSQDHLPPISKAPAERTLLVAVIALVVVAIVQLIAAGIALAPRIDFEKWARAMTPRPVASDSTPVATTAPAASPVDAAKADQLLHESQDFYKKGNAQGALEGAVEADRLLPNNAGILGQMVNCYLDLGKTPEAVAVLKRIVSLPPSSDPADADIRAKAQQFLAQMPAAGSAAPSSAAASASTAATAPAAASDASGSRDEIGIPTGSVMGIVDVKFVKGDPGQKNLSVATKAASGQKIDPAKFQATVDFYEQDDQGQIVYDEAHPPSDWLSNPVDWTNGSPEIFQLKYRLPLEDRGDLPPLQSYGYVVAIYYNGELQDQRADPPSLLSDHAPPLHKDLPTE